MKYSQRIQELPPDERPYEKCLSTGPENLTDSELLAVILPVQNPWAFLCAAG